MHGPPVRRSPYASFIYTVSGGSAAALGQVPENTFALCSICSVKPSFCTRMSTAHCMSRRCCMKSLSISCPKTRPRLWMRWVPCLHMVPHLPGRRSFRSVPVRRFVRLQCGYCRSAQSRSERFLNFSAKRVSICSKARLRAGAGLCFGINPPCRMPAQRAGRMGEGIESLL